MNTQKGNMDSQKSSWISLNDYSSKYRVSISTLRRWIKQKKVSSYMRSGKYFLRDIDPKLNKNLVKEKIQNQGEERKMESLLPSVAKEAIKQKPLINEAFYFSDSDISFNEKQTKKENLSSKEPLKDLSPLRGDRKDKSINETKDELDSLILEHKELESNTSPTTREKIELEQVWRIIDQLLFLQSKLINMCLKKQNQGEVSIKQIQDLNTLVNLLEEENQKLKSMQTKEKEFNEWMMVTKEKE